MVSANSALNSGPILPEIPPSAIAPSTFTFAVTCNPTNSFPETLSSVLIFGELQRFLKPSLLDTLNPNCVSSVVLIVNSISPSKTISGSMDMYNPGTGEAPYSPKLKLCEKAVADTLISIPSDSLDMSSTYWYAIETYTLAETETPKLKEPVTETVLLGAYSIENEVEKEAEASILNARDFLLPLVGFSTFKFSLKLDLS